MGAQTGNTRARTKPSAWPWRAPSQAQVCECCLLPSLVFVVPVFACNTRMHFSHVSHVLLISCGRAVIVLGGSVARRARRNRRRRAAASASRAEIVQRPLRVVHVLARIEHCTKQSRCELFPKMALEQSEWRKCALHGLMAVWIPNISSLQPTLERWQAELDVDLEAPRPQQGLDWVALHGYTATLHT